MQLFNEVKANSAVTAVDDQGDTSSLLDYVLICAGVAVAGGIHALALTEWELPFAVNVRAPTWSLSGALMRFSEEKAESVTTNRGVISWGEVLGDTTVAAAMLEGLLHRSVVLDLDGELPAAGPPRPHRQPPLRHHRRPTTTNLTPHPGGDFR